MQYIFGYTYAVTTVPTVYELRNNFRDYTLQLFSYVYYDIR